LIFDTFHFLASQTAIDSIKEIDPDKIALVQLADFSTLEMRTPQEQRDASIHMRVFSGDGEHSNELSEILRRLDRIGYRGNYSFLVFNDDYKQLFLHVVVDHAKRSVKWVTDQVLRRSLPLRSVSITTQ